MHAEIDHDLTPDQWETLKVLRVPAPKCHVFNRSAVEHLVALRLANITNGHLAITREGRRVLLRGSPLLWDVAA